MTVHDERSTDPQDYQGLPQAIGLMSKSFADGFVIPLHEHERDQLLYAAGGIMRLRTEAEAWIVPRDSAVYIPAGTHHAVSMHGNVEMRTLYIDTAATDVTCPLSRCRLCCVNWSWHLARNQWSMTRTAGAAS